MTYTFPDRDIAIFSNLWYKSRSVLKNGVNDNLYWIDGAYTKGFDCICSNGFDGDGISCIDIDECQTDSHNCGSSIEATLVFGAINATCVNSYGGYECECETGDPGPYPGGYSGPFSGPFFDGVGHYCAGKKILYS